MSLENIHMFLTSPYRNLWRNRSLLWQLSKREVFARYKGSYLGIVWSFLIPMFMLMVYTFVFGFVFKSRWSGASNAPNNKAEFAMVLFCGMIVFNLFAEVFTRCPGTIVGNDNFVRKVVFPVDILPVAITISAVVNAIIGTLILVVAQSIIGGIHWEVLLTPIVMLPMILLVLGIGWFMAAIGVYFRDTEHIVGIITSAVMFLSPIFYPVSSVPSWIRGVVMLNPLAQVIANMRDVFVAGKHPQWHVLCAGILVGVAVFHIGYRVFEKLRGGFADVL